MGNEMKGRVYLARGQGAQKPKGSLVLFRRQQRVQIHTDIKDLFRKGNHWLQETRKARAVTRLSPQQRGKQEPGLEFKASRG